STCRRHTVDPLPMHTLGSSPAVGCVDRRGLLQGGSRNGMNKTVHEFECRDDIWKRVEALAKRRGVSTDEIVQAALIQLFTRKKGAEPNTPAPGPAPSADAPRAGGPPRPPGPPGPPPGRPTLPRPPGPPGPPGASRLPPPG